MASGRQDAMMETWSGCEHVLKNMHAAYDAICGGKREKRFPFVAGVQSEGATDRANQRAAVTIERSDVRAIETQCPTERVKSEATERNNENQQN